MRAQIMAGTVISMIIAVAFCLSLAGIGSGLGTSAVMHIGSTGQAYYANANSLAALASQMSNG
ncbi:MAG TPA: hypothetical protein VMV00_02400 [Candidatus Baltobacteraceae bacterium]|nr:hypothetical protein [Candidatus Baltobacteraceae bacterium]